MNTMDFILGGATGGTSLAAALFVFNTFSKLFFARIDKREERLDAGQATLDAQRTEAMRLLTAEVRELKAGEEILRNRVSCAEATLHECQVRHAESEQVVLQLQSRDAEREATIKKLQAKVEQLSALPTNERELP